jgi:hypothetical protein
MSGESYEIKNKRRRKLLKNRTPVEEENVPDDTVQLIINSEEGSVDNYEVESSSNKNDNNVVLKCFKYMDDITLYYFYNYFCY